MDKLTMAHEYALEMAKQGIPLKSCKELGWKYADTMQAEAEKRSRMEERPKFLFELKPVDEWQPDWSQARDDATAWEYLGHGTARWHTTKKGVFRGADLFGYSGVGMFLVERQHGF